MSRRTACPRCGITESQVLWCMAIAQLATVATACAVISPSWRLGLVAAALIVLQAIFVLIVIDGMHWRIRHPDFEPRCNRPPFPNPTSPPKARVDLPAEATDELAQFCEQLKAQSGRLYIDRGAK